MNRDGREAAVESGITLPKLYVLQCCQFATRKVHGCGQASVRSLPDQSKFASSTTAKVVEDTTVSYLIGQILIVCHLLVPSSYLCIVPCIDWNVS